MITMSGEEDDVDNLPKKKLTHTYSYLLTLTHTYSHLLTLTHTYSHLLTLTHTYSYFTDTSTCIFICLILMNVQTNCW